MRQAVKKQRWRVKKTLARKVDFRPIEDEDVRFAWAAYKSGAFASVSEQFEGGDMNPDDFYEAFVIEIHENFTGAWTLYASGKDGYMPVGTVLAFFSHVNPKMSPFMIIGDMVWYPWATTRNKVEAALNFFNKMRDETPLVEYADDEAKPFFEVMAKHGVMRRIGKSHNVYPDQAATIFETITPK